MLFSLNEANNAQFLPPWGNLYRCLAKYHLSLFPSARKVEKIAEKTIVKSRFPPLYVEVSEKIVKDLAVNFCRALVSLKENQL